MRENIAEGSLRAKRPRITTDEIPSAMLMFSKNKDGILSSAYEGRTVLLQTGCENTVKGKSVWMCQLSKHEKDGCWYARPFMEADEEFLMDLNPKRIGEMADCLWETKREMIISAIGQDAVSWQEKEIEALKKEISDLRKESIMPKEAAEIRRLKHELSGKDAEIAELMKKNEDAVRREDYAKALDDGRMLLKEEAEKLKDAEENAGRLENENKKLRCEIGSRDAIILGLKMSIEEAARAENESKAVLREASVQKNELERLRYAEANAKRAEAENLRLRREIESRDSRIAEMETALAENGRNVLPGELPDAGISQREAKAAELERELLRKKEMLESLINMYGKKTEGKAGSEENIPRLKSSPITEGIFHIGADEVFSEYFTAGAYDVAVSADRKTMTIKENVRGKAICESGILTLSGLERFLPFEESRELRTTIKENVFIIDLDISSTHRMVCAVNFEERHGFFV